MENFRHSALEVICNYTMRIPVKGVLISNYKEYAFTTRNDIGLSLDQVNKTEVEFEFKGIKFPLCTFVPLHNLIYVAAPFMDTTFKMMYKHGTVLICNLTYDSLNNFTQDEVIELMWKYYEITFHEIFKHMAEKIKNFVPAQVKHSNDIGIYT